MHKINRKVFTLWILPQLEAQIPFSQGPERCCRVK